MSTFKPSSLVPLSVLFFIFHLLCKDGDALEFPRKNLRFMPLKRSINNVESSSSSEDLAPMAQSYFITPEAPTTTTIKPTFKRRSTHTPISASWDNKNKIKQKKAAANALSEVDSSTKSSVGYNPFRQIVDTGFQPKNSFTNKKRRPSSIDMMRRDQNNNEGGVNNNNESITMSTSKYEKETGNGITNKKFSGRRKPKKVIDYAGVSPNKISSPRPSRFTGQRRSHQSTSSSTSSKNVNLEQVQGSSTSESPNNNATSNSRGSFSRSGRRSPRLLEPVEIQPAFVTTENKPLRRRKKFTTTPNPQTPLILGNNDITSISGQLQASSDPELQRINANVFANRRPFPITKLASSTSAALINPVNYGQDSSPLQRRMRHRPAQKTLLTPLSHADSEHESSSDAITVFAEASDQKQKQQSSSSSSESIGSSDTADAVIPENPNLPTSRNLSNRKPNPLDKLTNRQAAARRFLTPKKTTDSSDGSEMGGNISTPTTKAPVTQTTSRAPRKSPLSLANLRNRRIGGSISTTTPTTPSTVVSNVDPNSHEVLGNLDVLGDGALVNGSQPKNDTESSSPKEEGVEKSAAAADVETVVEEPKSGLAGLLNRNRNRPPLRRPIPGASRSSSLSSPPASITIPIKRGPLKPKPTQPTTEKPLVNVETTTQPNCEEGKRYNKILRKCIPAFKSG